MHIQKFARQSAPKILLLSLLLSAPKAQAQISVFFQPEYFVWQEFLDGRKVLEESGPRFVLGATYKMESDDRGFLFGAQLKGYYGEVGYDGETQAGTPVETTTQYYGGLGEVRGFYRAFAGKKYFLDVVGGLGVEGWRRSIYGDGGYIEEWVIGYGKLGVELDPRANGWLGSVGLKYPFYTDEVARLSKFGLPDIQLHPGKQPSLYFEGGYQFTKNFSVLAVFDSYWFDESDVESVGPGVGVFQPKSRNYVAGLKLQWTF